MSVMWRLSEVGDWVNSWRKESSPESARKRFARVAEEQDAIVRGLEAQGRQTMSFGRDVVSVAEWRECVEYIRAAAGFIQTEVA